MFLYQEMIKKSLKVLFLFLMVLFSFSYCEKQKQNKDEPFDVFIKRSSQDLCEKIINCNYPMIRTFPKHLQKEVTVDNCQKSLLVDLEEKISLHTDSMKLLARSCYEKILSANCTQYLAQAYGDMSCYSLKKESDSVYTRAKEMQIKSKPNSR